nr:hypothetical protein [Deltaproteobacteria bacterium]
MLEGDPAYYLYGSNVGGLLGLNRCIMSYGKHFYTTVNSPVCEGRSPGTVEGVMGFLSPTAQCGAVPLHRLYRAANGDHYYTLSAGERDALVAAGSYVSEGIAGYVWASPQG